MDENFEHEINELNDASPIDINYLNGNYIPVDSKYQ